MMSRKTTFLRNDFLFVGRTRMSTVELEGILNNRNLRKLGRFATLGNFSVVDLREDLVISINNPDIHNRDGNMMHAHGSVFINFREGFNVFFFDTLSVSEASFVILSENIGHSSFPSIGDLETDMRSILEGNFNWRHIFWEWRGTNSINQNRLSARAQRWGSRWRRRWCGRWCRRWTVTGRFTWRSRRRTTWCCRRRCRGTVTGRRAVGWALGWSSTGVKTSTRSSTWLATFDTHVFTRNLNTVSTEFSSHITQFINITCLTLLRIKVGVHVSNNSCPCVTVDALSLKFIRSSERYILVNITS
mmetsp:Transcript_14703/g.30422  ORF Transcript_14703/g.30422 Transcript_14703/m.30422 type:complete len:303 (-) Transcript_14703:161-1069(-)